jgi:hypothetical protein
MALAPSPKRVHSGRVNPSRVLTLLATVLAVLGLTAIPALAQEQPEQPTTATEQQPTPEQPDATGGTGTDGIEEEGGDESGAKSSGTEPTQEEKDRYNRYCTSKDSEPSHSDKRFCDDYKAKYGAPGATKAGKPTQEEIDRYNRYCRSKDSEPSHNDKKFCDDFKKKYPEYGKGTPAGTNTTPTDANDEDPKKEDEPDSGPLAFTGLDLWQLLLIGVVLVAGGLGARHLLRQKEAGA